MKKTVLLAVALVGMTSSAYAQKWQLSSQKNSEIRSDVKVQQSYTTDLDALRVLLKDAVETGVGAKPVIVNLPTVDGKIEKFAVYSNPVMEKSLAQRYNLGSYVGVGVDDKSKYVRFSVSPTELQSMIIKNGKYQFIEPISADKKVYGVFNKTNRTTSQHGFDCSTSEGSQVDGINGLKANGERNYSNVGITSRPATSKYRTYRLAISVTSEYTTYFGGVEGAIAQINATMTRVNGIFEKEFAIQLVVQDYPELIYNNANTDPYSAASSMGNWNQQLQNTLTTIVGNDNYDIGHLFGASGGGGNAGCIGCICVNPTSNVPNGKGSGYTSPANENPSGDLFDVDYVAHEMGHQLGGNHTFSHSSESSYVNVEPGGGTTIMGYAGITQDNIQSNSDAYFHYVSINQILNNLDTKNCGVEEAIVGNSAPTIQPLTAYTIPKGTAYFLDAIATDAEGDGITYNWEQYDSVNDRGSVSGDMGWGYSNQGALTRSFWSTPEGRRYFPSLPSVMDGNLTNKTTWESVSYVPRTLKYAVTVRDENAQKPLLASSETTVTVGNDGPFKFAGITPSTVLYKNASNVIKWDVANTNAAPYNVSNVKIDFTTDNGATWTDLVASTPNTGSVEAQLPQNVTGAVKLRISAINHIFYAVSPQVGVGTAPTSTQAAPSGLAVDVKDITKNEALLSWNAIRGASSYTVNYRKKGEEEWLTATSNTNTVKLENLEDETIYETQVATLVNSVQGAFSTTAEFKTKGYLVGEDYCLMNTGGNNANSAFISGLYKLNVANLDYNAVTVANVLRTYFDFTQDSSKTINLKQGDTYTVNYSNIGNEANYNDWIDVWIDYNRDGVFSESERIGSKSGRPSGSSWRFHTGNFTFSVPYTTFSGDKTLVMRVASSFYNKLASPCGAPWVNNVSAGTFRDFPVKIEKTLGVDNVSVNSSEVAIYPNPAVDVVNLTNVKGATDYKVYSADGRLVLQGSTQDQSFNVSSLEKGVYVVAITSKGKTTSTKLIKK